MKKLFLVFAALAAFGVSSVSGQQCHTQKYCDYTGCHDIVVCNGGGTAQCHTEKYCDYTGCHDIVKCQ